MTIRHAWPSGTPHNDRLLLTDSSTSNLSGLYNFQGDVYRAALCFTNRLQSLRPPRGSTHLGMFYTRVQRKRPDLYVYTYIFLLFKISVLSKISFVPSSLPPGCISFILDDVVCCFTRPVFFLYIL